MMYVFPTLRFGPGTPSTKQLERNAVLSRSGGGYVHGRKRFTLTRIIFREEYDGLTVANGDTLDDFIDAVSIAEEFVWEDVTKASETLYGVMILNVFNAEFF